MTDSYKLSQAGLDKLTQELQELRDVTRPKAVERLAAARAMGDLSENSEYTASREHLTLIDTRIMEIEMILRKVELISEVKDSGVVQLGDTVVVQVEDGHEEFAIVGELEADMLQNRISDTSPIGKALLGCAVGQTVDVAIPVGNVTYKIIEIKKRA